MYIPHLSVLRSRLLKENHLIKQNPFFFSNLTFSLPASDDARGAWLIAIRGILPCTIPPILTYR